jgi:putative ABC transport system substrate-binding protein
LVVALARERTPRSDECDGLCAGPGTFGWVAGQNIRIDYRFAADDPTLIKTYAAELVGLSPDAILASTNPTVAALREQTHTTPIVFVLVAQIPLASGLFKASRDPAATSRDSAPTMRR